MQIRLCLRQETKRKKKERIEVLPYIISCLENKQPSEIANYCYSIAFWDWNAKGDMSAYKLTKAVAG